MGHGSTALFVSYFLNHREKREHLISLSALETPWLEQQRKLKYCRGSPKHMRKGLIETEKTPKDLISAQLTHTLPWRAASCTQLLPAKGVTVFGDTFWNRTERIQACFCNLLLQKNSMLTATSFTSTDAWALGWSRSCTSVSSAGLLILSKQGWV